MTESREDFAEQLGRYLERAGFTQQGLANKIGMHRNTIVKWLNRTRWPTSRGQVLRVADELFLSKQERKALLQAARFSVEQWPTEMWMVPLQRDRYFTGRDDILESLRRLLVPGSATSHTQVISGLGGVGKTHTAIEYAYRFSQLYETVLWLQADSWEMLTSECMKLAPQLGLIEQEAAEMVVAEAKRWLQKHSNWLLILDNVENPKEILSKFVPARHQGSVLMTTRVHDVEPLAPTHILSAMSEQEGVLFFLRRTTTIAAKAGLEQASETKREEAKQIWELMDGLPLALDQAGAFILETGCSFLKYQEEYTRRRAMLLQRRGKRFIGHEMPVAITFSLAFERVEEINPMAADILKACSMLYGKAIPEEIFLEGAEHFGERLLANSEGGWDEAVGVLRDYSLVQRDTEKCILTVHRLVQAVQIDAMERDEQRQYAESVVRAVNEVFPHDPKEVASWTRCLRYLEQAQTCNALIKQHALGLVEAVALLNRAGTYLYSQALYTIAETLYLQALAISEQLFGPEHLGTASLLNNLAVLYCKQGKYGETVRLSMRSLAIYGQLCLVDHPETATALDNLGQAFERQGYYTDAEELYAYALAIRWKHLGPTHRATDCSRNNLAAIYVSQGKYEQAETLYQVCLRLCEEHASARPLDLADSLNNLGELYHEQGKYVQAEPLYRRALQIREQYLGADHPDVAFALTGLAILHSHQGKYAEAEPLYLRALRILEQRLGDEHPHVAYPLIWLAALYNAQNNDGQAELLSQRALYILKQAVPHLTYPHFADTLHDLAALQHTQGHYDEARLLYERALAIRSQELGNAHLKTTDTCRHLAALLHSMGRTEEAAILEDELEQRRRES